MTGGRHRGAMEKQPKCAGHREWNDLKVDKKTRQQRHAGRGEQRGREPLLRSQFWPKLLSAHFPSLYCQQGFSSDFFFFFF